VRHPPCFFGVAKAAYFPQISLTGLFGFQSNQLSSLFSGPTKAWQFTPQLTQPLFTGGRIKSNVRYAEAQQTIAFVRYERTTQTAFRVFNGSQARVIRFRFSLRWTKRYGSIPASRRLTQRRHECLLGIPDLLYFLVFDQCVGDFFPSGPRTTFYRSYVQNTKKPET
jgi:hypothetical protein